MREHVQSLRTGRGSVLAEYEPVGACGVLIREGSCAKTNPMGTWALGLGPWATSLGPWALRHGPWTMGLGPMLRYCCAIVALSLRYCCAIIVLWLRALLLRYLREQ